MISDKVMNQINQELDGTLSKDELAELHKHLQNDKEAQELFNKLQLLHKRLKEVPEIEPPAGIKESVMKALPAVHFTSARNDNSLKSKIVDLLQLPSFQLAGMFSLGAAAALLFLVVTQNLSKWDDTPAERAIGTIISPEMFSEANKIDSRDITFDDYKVQITTTRAGNTIFANINMTTSSNQVVQVLASSEGAENFRFNGLEFVAPNLIYANFGNDFFSAAIAGPGNWVLAFDDPDGTTKTLTIELKSEATSKKEVVGVQGDTDTKVKNETSSNL